MITPKKLFAGSPAAVTTLYTVTQNQKLIVKKFTVSNPTTTPQTYTATLGTIALYTTKTIGPLETVDLTLFQNQIANAADTITFTPTAALNVYVSGVETPAS